MKKLPKDTLRSNVLRVSCPWRLLVLLPLCLYATAPSAQENKETQKRPDEDEVVRVKTNLVDIDVMVKDKKGKYIPDLKAEDFTIFENGVQQKVEFFDPPLAGNHRTGGNIAVSITGQPVSGSLPRNIISLALDGQTT